MPESSPEPDPITQLIGRRVASLRGAMSQDALGKRMQELGCGRWSRTSVQKLESGRRAGVSVQELFALSIIFDLPPAMFLADPRFTDKVPLATDSVVESWNALSWLVGAQGLGNARGSNDFNDAGWYVDQALALGGAIRTLEAAPRRTGTRDEAGRLTTNPADVSRIVEQEERDALATIRAVLERVQRDGEAPLPTLPEFVHKRAVDLGVDLPQAVD